MANTQTKPSDFYKVRYAPDLRKLQDVVFAEVYDDYFGQSSWISTTDYDRFYGLLRLNPNSHVLDVASGWGASALRLARQAGCSVIGVELDPQAVGSAKARAVQLGLSERVRFETHDANKRVPFADNTFDAVVCFDAIAHLRDRYRVFAEWSRLLKPGGRLLFTDQILTGPISNEEIALRFPVYCLLTTPGYNERMLADASFELLHREDITATLAELARRHCLARQRHAEALRALEGDEVHETLNQYRLVAERLARERRLLHVVFFVQRPA